MLFLIDGKSHTVYQFGKTSAVQVGVITLQNRLLEFIPGTDDDEDRLTINSQTRGST